MRRYLLTGAFLIATLPTFGWAQEEVGIQPEYDVVKTTKIAGNGGWEKIFADAEGRRLYIPRTGTGQAARITVFDLDTLRSVGTLAGINAKAVAIDSKSKHGFSASKPVVMWDTQTQKPIKNIEVQGNPENILFDAFNDRVYVLSKTAPNVTVINSVDGSIVGTIDVGGMASGGVADGKGRVFIGVEDKDEVVVINAGAMAVSARYDLDGTGAGPVALAFDQKNNVLLIACRNETMIYMNADTGRFVFGLPIGAGVDSAAFNPNTSEIISAEDSGALTIAAVNSPTSFAMKGTIATPVGSRAMALDTKTGNILVATAKFAKEPAPASFYDIPNRGAIVPGSFEILTLAKKK